ncbi:MAG: hypothetical protein Q4G11_05770 [Gallicola sp.]|nr:hypothetical protein [Gallicola sp.]
MRYKLSFITLAILLIFSSCKDSADLTINKVIVPVSFPNQLSEQWSSSITLDANVILPRGFISEEVAAYKAELFIPDSKLVYEDLFQNEVVLNKTTGPAEDGTGGNSSVFWAESGSRLHCGQSIIAYTKARYGRIIESFHPHISYGNMAYGYNNTAAFSQTKDFSFLSRAEAFNILKKQFERWGISISDHYTVYSLDYATLAKEEEIIASRSGDPAPDKKWSDTDNSYYFITTQELDHIPFCIYDHGLVEDGSIVPGLENRALFSKDGLTYLSFSFNYDVDKDSKTPVQLCSMDNILEILKKKYINIISSKPIKITTASLNYVVRRANNTWTNFDLVPAWVFEVHETDEDYPNNTHLHFVFINAITGEEIL